MKLSKMDNTRRRLPYSRRPPLITLKEFSEKVGVPLRTLTGRLANTPKESRPTPSLQHHSLCTSTVKWWSRQALMEWHLAYESGQFSKERQA